MNLFIDIGNSRIKLAADRQPFSVTALAHQQDNELYHALQRFTADKIWVACGRSQAAINTLNTVNGFAKKTNIAIEIIRTRPKLLKINYSDIKQFGTDRFLNLLAARNRCQKNICVVSCGTAITLDFYTHTHIGGMILPGVMSTQQLLSDTTGLPTIARPPTLLGNDTATCIGAGIYIGLQNLIYRSIERIEQQQGKSFSVIFTGGDATVLQQTGIIVETLLFEGMHYYRDAN